MLTNATSAFRDGSYWGPNDEQANDTRARPASSPKTLNGKLYPPSPISPLQRKSVLGHWHRSLGHRLRDDHPTVQLLTPNSPIQPNWVPRTANSKSNDSNDEWTFGEHRSTSFHLRTVALPACTTAQNSTRVLPRASRAIPSRKSNIRHNSRAKTDSSLAIPQRAVDRDGRPTWHPSSPRRNCTSRLMKGYIEREGSRVARGAGRGHWGRAAKDKC